MALTIRQLQSDDWPVWRELRLAALADAPYAFGSTLADWQGDGDTEERWRRRLDTVAYNVVAELDDVGAVAMASGTTEADFGAYELISMWVAPEGRGRGVAAALIEAVAGWGETRGLTQLALAVKADNARAIAAYLKSGFVDAGVNDHDPTERWMTRQLLPVDPSVPPG
jgi:GNAT superfamily N-acetyltransferase